MNLKPTEIDLDAYILGVYESIMKPYWAVPKSSYYCRICNYTEFKSEHELTDHKKSREHQVFNCPFLTILFFAFLRLNLYKSFCENFWIIVGISECKVSYYYL